MKMDKKYQDKVLMYFFYIIQKKSIREIADILNCSYQTIRNWLITLNIPIRTISEAMIVPLEERFWEKVDKNGLNGCWIWTNSFRGGYGAIKTKGKMRGAHVVSWELHNGRKVKNGYIVHHECGNKKCVNPAHLQEMTEAKHLSLHNSKLTEQQVLEIRADWATGKYTQKQLAEKYNVSRPHISRIVNRKIWKHI